MSGATTESAARNHFSLPGEGRLQGVLGTALAYKAEAAQTGGRLVCAEITVAPGQGVPPHRHADEDEAFYVLAGRVVISGDGCGSAGTVLDQGGFFYGPRGQVHGFRAEGPDMAKLLVFVSPGTGIGSMFDELSAQQGMDPARVAEICGRYGITFASPPE